MLIGLAAKNAILIVEFARGAHRGAGIEEAALDAARLRFRPILMTAFAFIIGASAHARARGGAGSMAVMGTSVRGRHADRDAVGVFLVPGLFAMVERMSKASRRRPRRRAPSRAAAASAATELTMRARLLAVWFSARRSAGCSFAQVLAPDRPHRRVLRDSVALALPDSTIANTRGGAVRG